MKIIETEDKTIEIVRQATGVDAQTAAFILAMERGETDGDLEVIPADETTPSPQFPVSE